MISKFLFPVPGRLAAWGRVARRRAGLLARAPVVLAVAAPLLAPAPPLLAHPGSLDEYGGHFDEKTTVYHYHRPKANMTRRKRKFLAWIEPGRLGELQGKAVRVERPDAIWVEIPYRPAYQDLATILPPSFRDDGKKWVLIWFRHVSPEASANRGKKYNRWFRKKVMYELDRKLRGKQVSVQFYIPAGGRRLFGMVFLEQESVNLWLVLGGWSYYLLTQGKNPNEDKFRQAEDLARRQKAGLWRGVK